MRRTPSHTANMTPAHGTGQMTASAAGEKALLDLLSEQWVARVKEAPGAAARLAAWEREEAIKRMWIPDGAIKDPRFVR
jgi:hypothetical protein